MATERHEPDVLVANTGWSGTPAVTDIQADPDSKTWTVADPLRANNNNTSTDIHCSFPDPSGNLNTGADLQEFRVQLREFDSGQTGTAQYRIELWEFEASTWSLVRAGTDTDITGLSSSTSGQVVSFTWNASELTTISGANVGIKVFITKTGGAPTVRQTGDIGAVEWNADIVAPIPVTEETLALSGKTPTVFREDYISPAIDALALSGKTPTLDHTTNAWPSPAVLELNLVSFRGLFLNGLTPTIDVTTGGDLTEPVDEGTLTLTGKVPTVEEDHFTDVAEDDLVLTGQAPSVEEDHFTDVAEDDLVLAGKVPTLKRDDYVTPAIDALALTGQAPSVEEDHFTDVAEDDLVLAGKTPTVTVGFLMQPDEDPLVLTGQAPSVEVDYFIDVAEDDLVLAGQEPTLLRNTQRTPTEDALTLTGKTPTVEFSYFIDVGEDTLTLTGKVPDVLRGYYFVPSIDALALTGQAPSVEVDYFIDVAEDDLALTGYEPVITVGFLMQPDRDPLVLAGQAPSVEEDHFTDVAEDDLVLAGQAPTVLRGVVRAPTEDDLVLAGQAPSVEEEHFTDVAEDDLVLAGKQPSILSGFAFAPPPDTLALTGQAPSVEEDHFIDVAEDDLVLAGKQPSILSGFAFAPAPDTLALTGQAPSAEEAHFIDVAEDDLALSGQTPAAFLESYTAPGVGTLTLDGKQPLLGGSFSIPVSEDTLALTGQATTALTGTGIAVPPGRLNLVAFTGLLLFGYPPTVLTTENEEPDAGSLALAGAAPTLGYATAANISIAPAVGSLQATGYEPEDIERISPVIPVSEATLSLTGAITTRAYGLLLYGYEPNIALSTPQVNVGALSLTPSTPLVTNTSPAPVALPSRALSLIGKAPALALVDPTAETSVVLEGFAPDVASTSPTFFPDEGTLTLTGVAIVSKIEVDVSAGTLVLGGAVPSLATSDNTIITATVGGLTLTGKVPSYSGDNARFIPDAAALTLTEQQVYLGRSITPEAKGITLNGKVPLAGDFINPVRFPAADTLALTGQTPVVNVGVSPIPGDGSLTLSTGTPTLTQTGDHFAAPGARELQLVTYEFLAKRTGTLATTTGALTLAGQGPTLAVTVTQYDGARTRLISLTTRHNVKMLYD